MEHADSESSNQISQREIFDYAWGYLDAQRTQEIDTIAAVDQELKKKIELARYLAGESLRDKTDDPQD